MIRQGKADAGKQAWALSTLAQGRWRLEARATRDREVEVALWSLGCGQDPKGLVRKWRVKGQRAAIAWHTTLQAALDDLPSGLSLPEVLRALPNFHRFKGLEVAAA